MKKRKKISKFDIVAYAIAILLTVLVLYPLILVVSCSFSDPGLVSKGQVVLFPKGFTLEGYKYLLSNKDIVTGYANSLFYTVVGTIINLVVTVPAGYVLSKGKKIDGNGFFTGMFLFTMYFSGGMIPAFLLIQNLGLYNTRWVLLIVGAFNVFNCIICRSFFASMPEELEEAARIDGCSVFKTFTAIVLPVSKALIGVMVLYFAVAHWNSYFQAMIYIKDDAMQPLQVFLRRILILAQRQANMDGMEEYATMLADREALIRYAVIVVSSAPLLIIYPFLQKYFDKGIMLGSVKG